LRRESRVLRIEVGPVDPEVRHRRERRIRVELSRLGWRRCRRFGRLRAERRSGQGKARRRAQQPRCARHWTPPAHQTSSLTQRS
jgi:hypothetical protein